MTKERLKQCFKIRKELALVERQVHACEKGSHEASRLSERATSLRAEIDAVLDYIESLNGSHIRQLAILYYFEGMALKDAADYTGYSANHAGRLLNGLPLE